MFQSFIFFHASGKEASLDDGGLVSVPVAALAGVMGSMKTAAGSRY
jgi:hypothetical protein